MAEPIDPTDPPSQAEPDAERVDDLDHEIDDVREQAVRHDLTDGDTGEDTTG